MRTLITALALGGLLLTAGCSGGFDTVKTALTGGPEAAPVRSAADQLFDQAVERYTQGSEADHADAFKMIVEACEQGCAEACTVVGLHYSNGRDVKQSDEEALRYWGLASDANEREGMRMLASAYEGGLGTKADPEKAQRLYAGSCKLGNAEACLALGNMLDARGLTAEAEFAWTEACTGGNPYGCSQHARSLLKRDPKNAEARELLAKACRELDGEACELLKTLEKQK